MEEETAQYHHGDAVPATDPEANESDEDSVNKTTEEHDEGSGSTWKQKVLGDYDYG